MKKNYGVLPGTIVLMFANIFFSAWAIKEQVWFMMLPGVFCSFLALFLVFQFGKQAGRGFVVDEDEIPRIIYDVVAIAKPRGAGEPLMAILRDNNGRRIACRAVGGKFEHFDVMGPEFEAFFVPKSLGIQRNAGETSLAVLDE